MTINKSTRQLKVITVDDSPLVAKRMKEMLSDLQHVKFLGNAGNVSEALLLIDEKVPNVVILDIHLENDFPKSNGIDLMVKLRKNYPEMTIIMFTNMAESQYRSKCLANGADYFFNKTDDFEKVIDVVLKIQMDIAVRP